MAYTLTMTTKTLEKKYDNLSQEVVMLRSFIIGIAGRDPEGEYRPEFVKRIREAAKEKSTYRYTGPGSLLKLIKAK